MRNMTPVSNLLPLPECDIPRTPVQGNDLGHPIAIQVRQHDTLRERQPLRRQTAFLHQLPAPLAITPEPEEAIPRAKLASDIAPRQEIEMAIPIEISQGQPWCGHSQGFQPHRRGCPPSTAVSQVHLRTVRLIPLARGAVEDQIWMTIVIHVPQG